MNRVQILKSPYGDGSFSIFKDQGGWIPRSFFPKGSHQRKFASYEAALAGAQRATRLMVKNGCPPDSTGIIYNGEVVQRGVHVSRDQSANEKWENREREWNSTYGPERSGGRAGTNHKHGPSKSGRKCPKCGV